MDDDIPNIPGIRMMHSIFCDEELKLSTALTSYTVK